MQKTKTMCLDTYTGKEMHKEISEKIHSRMQ